jgi:RHS repeat-associated protein
VQSSTLPQTPASCDNAGGTPNDARYYYDDQGNRVVKDGAQFHVYPNQNYSTNGVKQYKHIYIGAAKLLTKFVEPTNRVEDRLFYSHSDHLGSTGFVTDTSGGMAEHLQYFPGGETWVSEHPSQPVPQQYTGKELDPETDLYYYGARYYDPRTQVWQTPDPALESYLDGKPNGGAFHSSNLALYTYAYNNPIRLVDPDGQFPWNRIAGAAKLVGGVAEAAAGVALGTATSWTGVGAVGGALVAAHGLDVAISGARQMVSGEDTSSFTSQAMQAAGVSKGKADLVDAGVSIVGSLGAGVATKAAARGATALARAGTAAKTAETAGGEAVTVYRGTANVAEREIISSTGKSMSDAAKAAYVESGGSVDAAMAASREAHAAGVAGWGSEGLYAQAHAAFGQELSQIGPRSMISFTTDTARAKHFAGPNGTVYKATVQAGEGIWQTLPGATESEVLIRHMIEVVPWGG